MTPRTPRAASLPAFRPPPVLKPCLLSEAPQNQQNWPLGSFSPPQLRHATLSVEFTGVPPALRVHRSYSPLLGTPPPLKTMRRHRASQRTSNVSIHNMSGRPQTASVSGKFRGIMRGPRFPRVRAARRFVHGGLPYDIDFSADPGDLAEPRTGLSDPLRLDDVPHILLHYPEH